MIVRTLEKIVNTERDVPWTHGRSRRFLLQRDDTKFSFTDTVVNAGTEMFLQYPHHTEACYCIEGEGEIEAKGEVFPLRPGTLYCVQQNEQHILRATSQLRLVCIFIPPLEGNETHEAANRAGSSSGYELFNPNIQEKR